MNTTDEQIKTVETIRDETFPHGERGEHAALTALLSECHEMRELLEAAVSVSIMDELRDGKAIWTFHRDQKSEKWSSTHPKTYKLESDSALDAYREVKKQI